MIAPVRDWQMGREEEIAYAREHGIPIKGGTEAAAVLDRRQPLGPLLGGPLDRGPRRSRRATTSSSSSRRPSSPPTRPEIVAVGFEAGAPVALDGERLGLVELIERAAELGCRHGVGIVDHIEDRIVGLKVRDIYEVPAATIILTAHRSSRSSSARSTRTTSSRTSTTSGRYLCYAGLWLEPLRDDLDAYMATRLR